MSKRTWQPKKLKRLRIHGFLKRMAKGRARLTVSSSTK